MKDKIEALYPKMKYQVMAIFTPYYDRFTSEEFTQDVFVLALSNVHKFNGQCKLNNWIYKIAKNLCNEKLRRDVYRDKQISRFFELELVDYSTPEKKLIDKTELNNVIDNFNKLNDFDKDVIINAVKGIKAEKASKEIGVSESAYKVRLYRARKRLRQTT
tara:strand:- start:821 stop:1300 length:480 start_codon:yes stop_codon:yes gene_type:complete